MLRLLFVDDEPRLLQGLRLSLRGQRSVWEMVFVEGATAALEKLVQAPFDAVISDMRMPVVDGAELLQRVRLAQPDALRIVLSGQMDEETATRAAASAHRFLAKPCTTEVLVGTLSRAFEVRDQLKSDRLRRCMGGMATLPSLPAACVALNNAIQNDNVALNDVSRIIESDLAMTAKVLQLVNSAFFGLPRHVASIDQAMKYLGLNAVRSLVVAHALFKEFSGEDVARLELEQKRSLLAAQYARRFSLVRRQAEVAVTGSLLHNIGQVALISRLPKEYEANHEHASQQGVSIDEAERARLGVTHAAIGAYLLALWGLPFEVIQAVGSQHAPLETLTSLDSSAVVWIAKGLAAEALGTVQPGDGQLPDEVLARLGVGDMVATIRAEIAESGRGRKAS